jgi:hypothetical protein
MGDILIQGRFGARLFRFAGSGSKDRETRFYVLGFRNLLSVACHDFSEKVTAVKSFEGCPERWILVKKGTKTMMTSGNHLAHLVLLERFDIFPGQELEKKVVAHAIHMASVHVLSRPRTENNPAFLSS